LGKWLKKGHRKFVR